jgi:hypothetical protein
MPKVEPHTYGISKVHSSNVEGGDDALTGVNATISFSPFGQATIGLGASFEEWTFQLANAGPKLQSPINLKFGESIKSGLYIEDPQLDFIAGLVNWNVGKDSFTAYQLNFHVATLGDGEANFFPHNILIIAT